MEKKTNMFKRKFKFNHANKQLTASMGISDERTEQIIKAVREVYLRANSFSEGVEIIVNSESLEDTEMIFALIVFGGMLIPPHPGIHMISCGPMDLEKFLRQIMGHKKEDEE